MSLPRRTDRARRALCNLTATLGVGLLLLSVVPAGEALGATKKKNSKTSSTSKRKAARKPAPAAPAAPARVEVTLLHTTDVHGRLLGWNYETGRPDPSRGLAPIATLVKRVRAEAGAHVMLVDAGDGLQGTPLSWLHAVGGPARQSGGSGRPDPLVACMNAMGYDAFVVGNHEFDFGVEAMRRAQRDSKFAWLSANTLEAGLAGAGAFQPYLVREFQGVKVGLLGLTTPGIPSWNDSTDYAGLRFDDPLHWAGHYVRMLRDKEGCDAVVLVCHFGTETNDAGRPRPFAPENENRALALARQVKGVDVIVMGHTHAAVESRMESGVLLTQAGRHADHLGRVDLVFERDPETRRLRLTDRRARLVPVTAAVPPDSAVAAIATPYHDEAEAFLQQRIGTAAARLGGEDAWVADNALLDLIHRAQLAAGKADVSLASLPGPRAAIAAGPVTMRDVFALAPYENRLSVLEMSGSDLKEALEHAARVYETYDFGRGDHPVRDVDLPDFHFETAAGVTYTLDVTRAPGERVRDLRFRGHPIDPKRRLRVAVSRWRVNGGGGYTMLARGRETWRSDVTLRELLAGYIQSQGELRPEVDRNWRLVPAWLAESPARREPLERLVRLGIMPADSALAWGPGAPLTAARYAAWLKRAGAAVDPFDAAKQAKKKKVPGAAEVDPKSVLGFERARDWAALALPEAARDSASLAAMRLEGELPTAADRAQLDVGGGAAVFGAAVFPHLTFLHITDFHGALLSPGADRATQRRWGSAAVLAAHLERERARNPRGTILTDGGDWMQGTPISNLAFGRPVIDFFNRIGLDAASVGNHEFDWSADTLAARLGEARFAPLAANWMVKGTDRRAPGVAPWTIVSRRGVDVGIIGLCTEETPTTTLPKHVAQFEFPAAAPVGRAMADSARAGGADVVLVLGHLPGRQDSSGTVNGEIVGVTKAVQGEIAVFGGHSHQRVNGVVDGTPVLISQALGTTIGRLDVVLDRRRLPLAPIAGETRAALLSTWMDSVRPDSTIRQLVERADAAVRPLTSRVLATAAAPLGRSRQRDSAIGNWVADAMRASSGADFAFTNPGGLRTDLEAGEVTWGDVYEVLPFDNQIATVRLTGAQVLEVLEAGVSPSTCIQVSGLSFTFDPSRPRGERVMEVRLPDGTRIDMAKEYLVAANDFMTQGGDDFNTFARGKDLRMTSVLLRDAAVKDLEARTARGEKLAPAKEQRIINLSQGAGSGAGSRRPVTTSAGGR